LRILHLSSLFLPRQIGGAEKVVATLAAMQSNLGHAVGAAFLVPDVEPISVDRGIHRYPLHRGNLLWAQDSANYPSALRIMNKIYTIFNFRSAAEFGRAIDNFRPDVVHTHSLVELPPLVWEQVSKRGIPLVHTLHDYDLLCIRASLFKDGQPCVVRHAGCAIISRWKKHFHDRISTVVAVSEAVLDTHLKYGCFSSLAPAQRKVIWNPVPEGIRKDRRRGEQDITFGFIGRLVPEKGLEVLINACRLLPQKNWRLRVAGRDPGGSERYPDLARGLAIEFDGFVDSAEFLAEIDVLVVPSIWNEPFGLTVIEALAAGVTVLGAASGAIPELVGQVDRRNVFPANDATALAGRMKEIIDGGSVNEPDATAVSRLLAKVNPERITQLYLETYEQAIARAA
jgi:glycogen(starch) synthase